MSFSSTKRKTGDDSQRRKVCRTNEDSTAASASSAVAAVSPPMGMDASSGEGYLRANPETMSSRRIVSGTGSSASTASRRKLFNAELLLIHEAFASAADDILERYRNGDESAIPENQFFTAAVKDFIRQVAELKRRYNSETGDVMVCGTGDCGQLGLTSNVEIARKVKVIKGLRGHNVIEVSCGGLHTLALRENGTVLAWGCNDDGSLGTLEDKDLGYVHMEVTGFHPSVEGFLGERAEGCVYSETGLTVPFKKRKEERILQVFAGETASVAVSETGNVYFWGALKDTDNRSFRPSPPSDDTRRRASKLEIQLEDDETIEKYMPPKGSQNHPIHVTGIRKKVTQVSAGAAFAVAVHQDGTIVTWGVGTCGEMARNVPKLDKETTDADIEKLFLTPLPPVFKGQNLSRIVMAVSCGGYHLLVLARDAVNDVELSVYSSGLNNYGQLGHGTIKNLDELTKVDALIGHDISQVEGGFSHSLFLDASGKKLYACGRSDYGQIGNLLEPPKEAGSCENKPTRIPLVYDPPANRIHEDDKINEDDIDEDVQPVIKQISAGSSHNFAVTNDGEVYSWGFGQQCATGHGEIREGMVDGKVAEEDEDGMGIGEEDDPDVHRPKKLVTTKMGKNKDTTIVVSHVSGGGQHSAFVVKTIKGVSD